MTPKSSGRTSGANSAVRTAIWRRYLGPAAASVDLVRIVDASDMFTPADIEFAARTGAQAAFEHELTHREGKPATTEDYLAAIAGTRPSLTEQTVREFNEDIGTFSRM